MLLLMEKMCRRGEGTKVSGSRVTNFVSKTYSRVALVIDLWDQTGPDWSPPWNGGVTPAGKLVIPRGLTGRRGPRQRPKRCQGCPRARAEGALSPLALPSRSSSPCHISKPGI